MILIFVTYPNKAEAVKIGNALLNKKLAVCWNLFPVESNYRWKDKVVKDKELLMIIKTKDSNFSKIEALIRQNHSYEIPETVAVKAEKISKPYLKWLMEELA